MDLKNIYSLFDTAVAHKLKWPTIRLQLNGDPVILKRAGQKSRYTGQIQITNGARYGADNAKYYGRIDLDGVFQSSTPSSTDVSLFKLLLELAENPAQVAAGYGKLTGNCCFCGLTLTDPQSTAVGYGPICAGNYGLPHGQNRATKAETVSENRHEAVAPVKASAPTVEDLLADPSTPYWAADVIRVAVQKDCVDAYQVFAVLAKTFKARCA